MGSWAIMAINAALLGGCCFLVANIVTEIAAEAIEPNSVGSASAIHDSGTDVAAAAAPSIILQRNLFGAQLAGEAQVEEVTAQKGPGDLNTLLNSGHTWTV